MYHYTVSKREDLNQIIIPFFDKYPLRTSKKKDFELFKKCLLLMKEGKHLSRDGAIKIAFMCEQMNHQKPRTELIKILRNQTSDSVDGEDRVHTI